ncbi:MAG: glycosyltransferase family 2 protein [Cyanophyceae cyanobacterium]
MKLSVIIPVYNEIHTLDSILGKVVKALPEVEKEIIIVDDGSTDGTREWLMHKAEQFALSSLTLESGHRTIKSGAVEPAALPSTTLHPVPTVTAIYHEQNQGKGAALRTGFQAATGDVITVQDADLEYDPQDWCRMWRLIVEGWADVVYGSRFYGEPHRVLYFHHYLGNKIITNAINLLCNTTLSDVEVGTKMFRSEVLEELQLTCNDFGFEVEFTVKVSTSHRRWRLYETGIAYYGRTYAEGKKISWRDGLKALWYVIKFRLGGRSGG